MKKYIKPTAEVVELSVKESLSALPNGLGIRKVTRNAAAITAAATVYVTASTNLDDIEVQ